jgi:hypothetical protein
MFFQLNVTDTSPRYGLTAPKNALAKHIHHFLG